MSRSPHIVNAEELEWREHNQSENVCLRRKPLARKTGGARLGCTMYELPPGKRAWPYHYHEGNEEALYMLAGGLTLRLGEERFELGAGDYASFPVGPAGAHQMINEGSETARFLLLSTMDEPDVVFLPDSKKWVLFAGAAPGTTPKERRVTRYVRDVEVDYWEGEE